MGAFPMQYRKLFHGPRPSFAAGRALRLLSAAALMLAVSACTQTQTVSQYSKKVPWSGPEPTGTYKVGKPYRVGSDWYYPSEDFNKSETGIASWYGPTFHGKRTANGEIYDQHELTAAHRTLQMPSLVRVTNLDNGRSIVVRINDRGPFKRGRVIDVSKRAAELLGFIGQGTARVRLEVLEKESRKIAAVAKSGKDTSHITLAELNRMHDDENIRVASAAGNMYVPAAGGRVTATPMAPTYVASRSTDSTLPESLQTPTITVEELDRPGRQGSIAQPSWSQPAQAEAAPLPPPAYAPAPPAAGRARIGGYGGDTSDTSAFSGHVDDTGRFMPDAVVQTEPVVKTGLFVQAGSFGVYENAQRLSAQLSAIAPTVIENVAVQGKTMYRVKLGPLATVEEADRVLSRVVQAGNGTARVIRN